MYNTLSLFCFVFVKSIKLKCHGHEKLQEHELNQNHKENKS